MKTAAYEIARREANKFRTILRRVVAQGLLSQHSTRRAYSLAGALVGMLTAAAISLDKRT